MRPRNSCSPVVLLDLVLRRVQRDTSTFISFGTTPFTPFSMLRLVSPGCIEQVHEVWCQWLRHWSYSLHQDCSCWRVLGPLDSVSDEISCCSCFFKGRCLTDEFFNFLPPMQQFCCEVVHSLLVNLIPVCAIIFVYFLSLAIKDAWTTSCKSFDCTDCKHNSHKVPMLL